GRAGVKEEWRGHLEELGAAIKRPLGDSTLVVDAGTRRRLRAILALQEVDHVEAHAANVSVSPEFVQALGVKGGDEADLAAAAERVATNEVVADPHLRPAAPPAGLPRRATSLPHSSPTRTATRLDAGSPAPRLARSTMRDRRRWSSTCSPRRTQQPRCRRFRRSRDCAAWKSRSYVTCSTMWR